MDNPKETLRLCSDCDRLLPESHYYRSTATTKLGGKKVYVNRFCKDCSRERTRRSEARVTNKTKRAPQRLTPQGMSGKERRAYWTDYKRRKGCIDCGEKDWRILQFDHLPHFEKLFNIGEAYVQTGVYTDMDIQVEVAKCEVVCQTCHLQRTRQRRINPKNFISMRAGA